MLIQELQQLRENAAYAKQLVRGEKSGPGILNKINQFVTWKLFFNKDKNRFLPAKMAVDQLKKAGFSPDQIHMIREAATEAAYVALDKMKKKYPDEIETPKYSAAMDTSFQVFELFLNVSDEIRMEYAELFQKLFDKKIDKIASKLELTESLNEEYDSSIDFEEDVSKIGALLKKVEKLIHSGNMHQWVSDTDYNLGANTRAHHDKMVKKLKELKATFDAFYEEMQRAGE